MQVQALTDIGRKRQVNQDYIFQSAEPVGAFPNLFILADGMGGHKGGDFASKYLTETMVGFISKTQNSDIIKVLRNAVRMSNTLIYEKSHSEPELSGMGSTLVAAVISGGVLTAANVGDSRLYIIRDGIIQVTKDHSYVEELVEAGEIERYSEEYNRKKNIITRAIGTEESVEADYFEVDLIKNDHILLCSDGLTNMVDEDTILAIISGHGSLQYKARTLVEAANENGGNDNIAVILIRYEAKDGDPHA
ncbi:MAG: Stp1/IreP family PP2C-type Ser/Thr phosphatase [Lachnospiraceae bacterium]|nr:Stp1/IreP family PP2C-type Ser/Thr phosphatase [Lachnospiraceae bacterium]